MPRAHKPVKLESPSVLGHSMGAVDLHFHGAFGIDLMSAPEKDLDRLSSLLWKNGIAAFCPTTLSAEPKALLQTVEKLGSWIQKKRRHASKSSSQALPLGIHIEGPFINPKARGAHHHSVIRKPKIKELEALWLASQKTIKIITLAPEILPSQELRHLGVWAKKRKLRLSLGHSCCSESLAHTAFKNGFTGITHAWNALHYHHRDSGAIGAAFQLISQSQKDTPSPLILELIIDQLHLSPSWIQMSLQLFPHHLAFVSDCAPAAGLSPSSQTCLNWVPFGNLKCHVQKGAVRLKNGTLAGGALLLTKSFSQLLEKQVQTSLKSNSFISLRKQWKSLIPSIGKIPLQAIGLSPREQNKTFSNHKLVWHIHPNRKITYQWVKKK